MESIYDVADVPGDLVVVGERDDASTAFAAQLGSARRVGVGDRTRAETLLALQRIHRGEAVAASRLVNELRRVKSPEELDLMERAAAIAVDVMSAVAPRVVAGVTMLELLDEVEHQLRARRSRVASFPTHIFTGVGEEDLDSVGPRAREPLREGQAVLFDFGAVLDAYCSDFGRTIWCGEPRDEDHKLYDTILAAQ